FQLSPEGRQKPGPLAFHDGFVLGADDILEILISLIVSRIEVIVAGHAPERLGGVVADRGRPQADGITSTVAAIFEEPENGGAPYEISISEGIQRGFCCAAGLRNGDVAWLQDTVPGHQVATIAPHLVLWSGYRAPIAEDMLVNPGEVRIIQ